MSKLAKYWMRSGDVNENFTLNVRAEATKKHAVPGTTRIVVVGIFVDNKSWILFDKIL